VNLVVYGDFSSPDSYLASRRVDALIAAGMVVDWRAVECSPLLPVSGRRLLPAEQDALADRFGALDGLLLPGETLPWSMPAIVPKTEAAVSAYAAAESGDDVRRLLFELYWLHGADIGNPAVLRTPLTGPILRAGSDAAPLRDSGYAVSVGRGPITTARLPAHPVLAGGVAAAGQLALARATGRRRAGFWPDWRAAASYSPDEPAIRVLLECTELKVVLVTLSSGHALPAYPGPAACFHILAGTGSVVVDDEEISVAAGSTVIAPSGSRRAVRAGTQLVFLGNLGDPAADDVHR